MVERREGDLVTIQGIFKTIGRNPENGKPNVIALMFNEGRGISLDGGALDAGVHLGFGGSQAFDPLQWIELSDSEYDALLKDQQAKAP